MPILDTNILIDHLRNRPEAVGFMEQMASRGNRLVGSVICRAEVLNGMRPDEADRTLGLLTHFEWLDVTEAITDASSEYFRRFHASHGLDLFDSLIAATARHHSLELYTANKRHYPMRDIKVVQPY